MGDSRQLLREARNDLMRHRHAGGEPDYCATCELIISIDAHLAQQREGWVMIPKEPRTEGGDVNESRELSSSDSPERDGKHSPDVVTGVKHPDTTLAELERDEALAAVRDARPMIAMLAAKGNPDAVEWHKDHAAVIERVRKNP